jgi:hypothetical protein
MQETTKMNKQTGNRSNVNPVANRKITISSIILTRAEGLTAFCGIPHMVSSMSDAQAVLMGMSRECAPVASDKVDFTVTYDDGHEYTGTYNLGKFDYGDLAGHMRTNLNTRAQIGLDVATLNFMRSIDRDGSQRRAALDFLATRKLA